MSVQETTLPERLRHEVTSAGPIVCPCKLAAARYSLDESSGWRWGKSGILQRQEKKRLVVPFPLPRTAAGPWLLPEVQYGYLLVDAGRRSPLNGEDPVTTCAQYSGVADWSAAT